MSEKKETRFHRPMYADMWKCIWFYLFGWLIQIELHLANFKLYSSYYDEESKIQGYRVGVLHLQKKVQRLDKGKPNKGE